MSLLHHLLTSYHIVIKQRRSRRLLAISTRSTRHARALLRRGADVNVADLHGYTPLMWAAQSNAETVRLLLDWGADVHARCHDLSTPMHWAANDGRAEAVRLLLDHGADIDAVDDLGRTPLWGAAITNLATVAQLIKRGADANIGDCSGWTPLMCAACLDPAAPSSAEHITDRAEIVRLLIQAGADVNAHAVPNEYYMTGCTALAVAKLPAIIDILQQASGKEAQEG